MKMKGVTLPGDLSVRFHEYEIPKPDYGQVLIRIKAITLCGSDKMLYTGKARFPRKENLINGHEVAGVIMEEGDGLRLFHKGDRVIVYHHSGCGICYSCRKGYVNLCRSTSQATYGWQRDGGLAEYMIAEEKDLIKLPDSMSYLDGTPLTCSFGAVYEAMKKVTVSGDHSVAVTGLGPVGLSCLMLAKAMGAKPVIGIDHNAYRRELALRMGWADAVFTPKEAMEGVRSLTGNQGVERAFDASGDENARRQAIDLTRECGKCTFLGEGGKADFEPTRTLIHAQKTIQGSWASPVWQLEDLMERLERWNLHPEKLVTHTFRLDQAAEMFALMNSDQCGKVAVVFDED
ncbi:MAG: zinc-binding dehydrogenase [Clostridia bacterium]|nr:zinc-binding dehydrogenase [Clostridia bacterium]